MSDTITLPREVVKVAFKALVRKRPWSDADIDAYSALRTALAAPPAPTQAAKSLITAPKPMLGLISNEVRAALKAADAVESQEAYLTRTPALAAEQPKPSGTPIEKIVEEMIAESPEMALYLPDARRQYILDAARYRWLREWMVRHSILCLEYGGRWALRKPHFISSSVGCGETEDAAIDAAMAQDKR